MNRTETDVKNAFGAPVFHIRETESTMADARQLAESGVPDGTVIYADFQSAGRGRIEGRTWEAAAGENLLCTVILRRRAVPGFTLRVGLAVARAFDAFLPPGGDTRIKWPNDVLYGGKKLAGVLCENTGSVLYVGTGMNIGQTSFPAALANKAASLKTVLAGRGGTASGILPPTPAVAEFLAVYLEKLFAALDDENWNETVTEKLYRRGEKIRFLGGDPGRNETCEGTLEGIGKEGELLLRPPESRIPAGAGPGIPRPGDDGLRHIFSGEIPW